jgi:hypothetical protein
MAKIKIVSHPFHVVPVLAGRNTKFANIGPELVGDVSRDVQHDCYPVKLISSNIFVI